MTLQYLTDSTASMTRKLRTKRSYKGFKTSGSRHVHDRRDSSVEYRRKDPSDGYDHVTRATALERTLRTTAAKADEYDGLGTSSTHKQRQGMVFYATATPGMGYAPELEHVRVSNLRRAGSGYDDLRNHCYGGIRRSGR